MVRIQIRQAASFKPFDAGMTYGPATYLSRPGRVIQTCALRLQQLSTRAWNQPLYPFRIFRRVCILPSCASLLSLSLPIQKDHFLVQGQPTCSTYDDISSISIELWASLMRRYTCEQDMGVRVATMNVPP